MYNDFKILGGRGANTRADGLVELPELPETEHLVVVLVVGLEHDLRLIVCQAELRLKQRQSLRFLEAPGETVLGLVLAENSLSLVSGWWKGEREDTVRGGKEVC
ncbi:hypothetical protein ElyMa_004717900 [Elysia marginata]|uniref:Uncharacterized protein n=1 Tax=Elysia marginata TaxID=1093978 RepID=A0AAV4IBN5_9GAST|nr:hypothetical protein ElyMa_004717900 [Elysia marginata]